VNKDRKKRDGIDEEYEEFYKRVSMSSFRVVDVIEEDRYIWR